MRLKVAVIGLYSVIHISISYTQAIVEPISRSIGSAIRKKCTDFAV